jgi:sodium-dependent dicarboxylate transporter 2/3/5
MEGKKVGFSLGAMNAKKIGLFLGAALFILMRLLPVPEGMEASAWAVAAITVLMGVWWITEAIPIPATALLPIPLYTLLNVMKAGQVTTSYGNEVIYLFMGGFFLAVTMEHWNLHRRIALLTVRIVGTSPNRIVLGFMIAVGALSMWISNTACAVMMVPIGIAVISQIMGLSIKDIHDGGPEKKQASNFAKALMIGIAYAASIGGVATLIGTPPNMIMKGQVQNLYGIDISFLQWLMFGFPFAVILMAIAYFLLTRLFFPTGDLKLAGSRELIDKEISKLGDMSRAEISIAVVGGLMALAWITRGLYTKIPALSSVSDTTVAIVGSMLLFLIPVDFKKGVHLLEWKTAVKIPWDIVLLFGGGFALADGFRITGLALWLSSQLTQLSSLHIFVFILIIALLTTFLTEVTSNTATATLLIPIMGAAAIAIGIHPFATIVTACLSASMAFMLPVATPPNAIVFGSGYLRIVDMAKTGLLLNIIGAIIITLFAVYLLPVLWGVDLSVVPDFVK